MVVRGSGCYSPLAAIPRRESLDDGGLMPVWLDPPAASVKLIAECDSRTFNMGFIASFWDDRIEAMFELMVMKWGKDSLRLIGGICRENKCDMMGFLLVMSPFL